MTGIRIGHGYDVHKFTQGNKIILAGVTIPYSQSLLAHSDGDVALHALCDALLGAAGLGDIGKHFPDTDERYKNVDSRLLLVEVKELLLAEKYSLLNCDLTVIAQAPKLAPHIESMKKNIAADLAIAPDAINVKATTTEGLGYIGRGEGIACHAVALIAERL